MPILFTQVGCQGRPCVSALDLGSKRKTGGLVTPHVAGYLAWGRAILRSDGALNPFLQGTTAELPSAECGRDEPEERDLQSRTPVHSEGETLGTVVIDFSDISLKDVPSVGGKNASLGELFRALAPMGVGALDGFATTADAYRLLLATDGLETRLRPLFASLHAENLSELSSVGQAARAAVLATALPGPLRESILAAYERLCARLGGEIEMAVRSSATAEDLDRKSTRLNSSH